LSTKVKLEAVCKHPATSPGTVERAARQACVAAVNSAPYRLPPAQQEKVGETVPQPHEAG
jgi:hypothetical protein